MCCQCYFECEKKESQEVPVTRAPGLNNSNLSPQSKFQPASQNCHISSSALSSDHGAPPVSSANNLTAPGYPKAGGGGAVRGPGGGHYGGGYGGGYGDGNEAPPAYNQVVRSSCQCQCMAQTNRPFPPLPPPGPLQGQVDAPGSGLRGYDHESSTFN